jgi:hypothetical protein
MACVLEDSVERLGLPLQSDFLASLVVLHSLDLAVHMGDAIDKWVESAWQSRQASVHSLPVRSGEVRALVQIVLEGLRSTLC